MIASDSTHSVLDEGNDKVTKVMIATRFVIAPEPERARSPVVAEAGKAVSVKMSEKMSVKMSEKILAIVAGRPEAAGS